MRWNAGRVAVFTVSSSCGAAFDASVNVLCVLGGACGRITVDTASVRPCGGLTARKPTPVGYTRFEAVKTASSVPLVTVSGTVKRPRPDETQPILSTTTTVVRALTRTRRIPVRRSLLLPLGVRDTDLPHVLIVSRFHDAR